MGELTAGRATFPGELLADRGWLADRVDQTARQWGCPERRTNATLWWYSASAVLLGPAVQAFALTGAGAEVSPAATRFTVRGNGYLERVIPGPGLDPGAAALGAHLAVAFGQVIEPLADVGRATERSLWAIAADSLATVLLSAAPVLASLRPSAVVHAAVGADWLAELAASIASAGPRLRPLPRYLDVAVSGDPPATRRYVRRGSCCLLVRVPDGKCLTCPNQTPADRLRRLTAHAEA